MERRSWARACVGAIVVAAMLCRRCTDALCHLCVNSVLPLYSYSPVSAECEREHAKVQISPCARASRALVDRTSHHGSHGTNAVRYTRRRSFARVLPLCPPAGFAAASCITFSHTG